MVQHPTFFIFSKWLAIIVSLTELLNEMTYFLVKPQKNSIFNITYLHEAIEQTYGKRCIFKLLPIIYTSVE